MMNQDIDQAEQNYIEWNRGRMREWRGALAGKLLNSKDFIPAKLAYQVWEVLPDTYDWATDGQNHAAILRANQSSLSGALSYMGENKVLVWRSDIPETEV